MVRRPVLSQVPAFLKQVRKYSTAVEDPAVDEPATSVSSVGVGEEGEDGLATVFKVGSALQEDAIDQQQHTTCIANDVICKKSSNDADQRSEKHNNNNIRTNKPPGRFKANTSNILHNSVFYIPFLLINSFLIFMVTPDLVILFIGPRSTDRSELATDTDSNVSEVAYVCCGISYAMCNLFDGCIYVFFHNDVRKMFLYHVARLRGRGGHMVG